MRRTVALFIIIVAIACSSAIQGQQESAGRNALSGVHARTLEAQILLDRAGFSPGEIDAAIGKNTEKAVASFQAAAGLRRSGQIDDELLDVLRRISGDQLMQTYRITEDVAAGPFVTPIPGDMMEKSTLPSLTYTSLLEKLGEMFHSAPELIVRFNPRAEFRSGEEILVPNVEVFHPDRFGREAASDDRKTTAGESTIVERIIVSKSASVLIAEDAEGRILLHAPVTSGSENDPLPLGDWAVTTVAKNPKFYYNPDLFWDADPSHAKAEIPPGPNNPVGVVWIDLTKQHYGIHGTPEPGTIGYTQSHGCVRLTNWDAAKLAQMVEKGTAVHFVP